MKKSILFFMLAAIVMMGDLFTADIQVKDINCDPYRYSQKVVSIKGKFSRLDGANTNTSQKSYYFQDIYGDEIKVVTQGPIPDMERYVELTGMIMVNVTAKDTQEVYIWERANKNKNKNGLLIALLILVLCGIVGTIPFVIFKIRKENNKIKDSIGSSATDSHPTETDDQNEQPQIPVRNKPAILTPDETVEFLPGKFIVLKGIDFFKEVRFYRPPTREDIEFFFGRCFDIEDYTHIDLKLKSVSKIQAKMCYNKDNDKYELINYSTVNPTKVNKIKMNKEDKRVLKEGDKIEMGEVSFLFTKEE